jgi:5-methylcytosine-specific restriction endonuclease McrA
MRCGHCKKDKSINDFTSKAKYCKKCVKEYNNRYSLSKGRKLKFIPIVNEISKQCCKCKLIKPLEDYSPGKRGRMGKIAYCKPCASLYQLKYTSLEKRREKTQRYRDANREWWRSLHRINQFNRRNKIKLASDGTVTPEKVKEIYNREICDYCKNKIERNLRTLEHKLPLNRGGLHTITNLTMICFSCNASKGDMTESEFIIYKDKK